jgi:hypothetical protein
MRSWNDKVVLALGTKGSGVPFLTDSQPANATEKIYASKIYYSSVSNSLVVIPAGLPAAARCWHTVFLTHS